MNKRIIRCGVISDIQAYQKLQAAEKASLLLLSDTHNSVEAVRWIFSFIPADACLFAGDGAADILAVYQQPEGGRLPPSLFFAQGNCDLTQYTLLMPNEPQDIMFTLPLYQTVSAAKHRILLTHGHLSRVELSTAKLYDTAQTAGCSFAVYGHTHTQTFERIHKVTIINSGSPSIPRGTSYSGFAHLIIDNTRKQAMLTFYKLFCNKSALFSAKQQSCHTIPLA